MLFHPPLVRAPAPGARCTESVTRMMVAPTCAVWIRRNRRTGFRMKAQFGYRAAGVLNRVMTPKSVIGLAKYMYINAIIDHHKIDLILDVGANTGAFATSMRLVGYREDHQL